MASSKQSWADIEAVLTPAELAAAQQRGRELAETPLTPQARSTLRALYAHPARPVVA